MSIKNTFTLITVQTVVKIFFGIVINKIIAVYTGPSGFAILGQFQNFSAIVTGLANGSIQTGLVKKTAENESIEQRKKVWNNALFLSLSLSILLSVIVWLLSETIANHVMLDMNYLFTLEVFAFSIIFYGLNLYILSILNGIGDVKFYTVANIFISLLSLIFVSLLTIVYDIEGAILGLIATQLCAFFVLYFLLYRKYKNSFFTLLYSNIDSKTIKTLLKYGLASFSSGVILAVMMIIARSMIVDYSSLDEAGIWGGAVKMGLYFNLLFALPISIHYLPMFSKTKNKRDLENHLRTAFKFLSPLMLIVVVFTYTFSDLIIKLIFTNEFLFISNIIVFILIAEVARVYAATLSNLFFAKQELVIPVRNEAIWALSFILGVYYSIDNYGLLGVSFSYLFASCLYLLTNILSYKRFLRKIGWDYN
jgi:polysaccharide transporter, PST family